MTTEEKNLKQVVEEQLEEIIKLSGEFNQLILLAMKNIEEGICNLGWLSEVKKKEVNSILESFDSCLINMSGKSNTLAIDFLQQLLNKSNDKIPVLFTALLSFTYMEISKNNHFENDIRHFNIGLGLLHNSMFVMTQIFDLGQKCGIVSMTSIPSIDFGLMN
jgi:hypothetical protein